MPTQSKSIPHLSPSVERILDAALRVFTRKGFNAATIREIMTEAEVTQPAIYYHFGSKLGLYKAVVESVMDQFFAEMDASLEGIEDHWERLCVIMWHHFSFQRRHPEKSAFIYGTFLALPRVLDSQDIMEKGFQILGVVTREIISLQNEGIIREGDPELMALSLVGAFNLLKMRNMFEPRYELSEERANWILRGFLIGSAAPDTLAALQSVPEWDGTGAIPAPIKQ